MSTTNTIILVEANPTEKENFIALAQKENWIVQAMNSSYEAIQWLKKNNEASLMVISEDATPLNAYQTFDYIRQELKNRLAVVISKSMETKGKEDGYTYIDKPYTTTGIKALKLVIAPNVSSAPGLKVYSLEYLETISGGNHEFLIDCLKTFISSVSDKMAELKTAVSSDDIKSIGAIAHNIKPSFEMLENEKARDICNKLTYEADTSDIPALATQLNNEFKVMEDALKNDFSELR
jgi:HPt (histidine-containing phosphotransfer) domain-containing protein/CheY-like chemotaxis protein